MLNAKLDRILGFALPDDDQKTSAIGEIAKTGLMVAGGLSLGGSVAGAAMRTVGAFRKTRGLAGAARAEGIGKIFGQQSAKIRTGMRAGFGFQNNS